MRKQVLSVRPLRPLRRACIAFIGGLVTSESTLGGAFLQAVLLAGIFYFLFSSSFGGGSSGGFSSSGFGDEPTRTPQLN